MRKLVSAFLILLTVFSLSSCNIIANEKNSIGKSGNTVITVYSALKENFALRKKKGYKLYGARLSVNGENVGTYTYVYTNKRPDETEYSDVLVVEVNNRTGRIEKFSAPEYENSGAWPYEMIQNAMPLDPASFAVDSDTAIKNAADAHKGEDFVYNYVELTLAYTDGKPVYKVGHISLVNECVYTSIVDVMTGAVTETSVEEL